MGSKANQRPATRTEARKGARTRGSRTPAVANARASRATTGVAHVDDAPMFDQALDSIMGELLAIDARRLLRVNVNVPKATSVVIGVARELRAMRPAMVARFGEEEASAVDRLELLARATSQAHSRHVSAPPAFDLPAIAARVSETRASLFLALEALRARKLIDPSGLGALRRRSGYLNAAFDVLQLVAFFHKNWCAIEYASGYTRAEIERAEAQANELLTAVSLTAKPPRSSMEDVRRASSARRRAACNEVGGAHVCVAR